MTQLSNVPMHPNPNATERPLTLVEKLEQKRDHHNHFLETCGNDRDKAYHSFGKKCYQEAINIVKQHSDWISADERLPNEDGKYLVYCVGNRELTKDRKELSIMRFNQKTKGGWFALSPLFKVIYWQPIQPPSEVLDD